MVHRPVCLAMLGGVALFGGEDSLRHPATPSQICSTSPVALARNPSFSSFLPTLNPAVHSHEAYDGGRCDADVTFLGQNRGNFTKSPAAKAQFCD
jgi:hypothetical protein